MPEVDDETKRTLETVKVLQSSNISSITNRAFCHCALLQSVCMETSAITSILGEYAFYGCTSLKTIKLQIV